MATHSSALAWRTRDRGAWWAAVFGVAQSRTRLKRLSSRLTLRFVVVELLSHVRLLCNPIDCSPQAPLSTQFPRQEYWSGLPLLLQGIFPTHRSNPQLLHGQVDSFLLSPQGSYRRDQSFGILFGLFPSHRDTGPKDIK